MPPVQLVIFDCDGVLVDSEAISHAVLAEMLSELGAPTSLDEAIEQFMGTSLPRCLELVGERLGRTTPASFRSDFAQRTQLAFKAQLAVVPGIEEVLAQLRQPYCVASNGNRLKMNFTLAHTGLLDRFGDRMFSADDVDKPKPAPDLLLLAARAHQAEPSRCVVIEDSPSGIRAARAAGMRAYGFTAMTPARRLIEAGAHVVFSKMSEFPYLLEQHERDA